MGTTHHTREASRATPWESDREEFVSSCLFIYSKTCLKRPLNLKEDLNGFREDYRLMQVKSITECSKGEHSAILSTFIKLPLFIKIFVLPIFVRPPKTGFTVFV